MIARWLPPMIAASFACGAVAAPAAPEDWRTLEQGPVRLVYQTPDSTGAADLATAAVNANGAIAAFFGLSIDSAYEVRVYPDRTSFDAYWRRVGIEPACWMIGRATKTGLELLAPRLWADERCGHAGAAVEVDQILRHETVHVLHARLNSLPEANFVRELKWFNEGVASYAAGQLGPGQREQAQSLARSDATIDLDEMGRSGWLYAVGATMAEFIDQRWGRPALVAALAAPTTASLLAALDVSPTEFVRLWRGAQGTD